MHFLFVQSACWCATAQCGCVMPPAPSRLINPCMSPWPTSSASRHCPTTAASLHPSSRSRCRHPSAAALGTLQHARDTELRTMQRTKSGPPSFGQHPARRAHCMRVTALGMLHARDHRMLRRVFSPEAGGHAPLTLQAARQLSAGRTAAATLCQPGLRPPATAQQRLPAGSAAAASCRCLTWRTPPRPPAAAAPPQTAPRAPAAPCMRRHAVTCR